MRNSLSIFLISILIGVSILSRAQSPRFESFKVLKNTKSVSVNTIFQDSTGYIWLGTNSGLVQYDGIDFKLFTEEDSLAENIVTSLNQDKDGVLWIGHISGKISKYINGKIHKFNPEEGISLQQISSFFVNHENVVCFSTFGEGIYYYAGENRKRLYNLNSDDGLLDNYVYDIAQDLDSNLYFATDKGISVYNLSSKQFINEITMSDGLPDNIVKQIILNGNDMWIAMEDYGICKYNLLDQKFSHINNWEFGSVNNFIQLSDNEFWISTKRKGVVKLVYNNKGEAQYYSYDRDNNLSDKRTQFIFKDREHNLWIGTQNGLSIRKNNNFEFLDESEGFNIKDIFSFIIDNQGNYWIASQQGLYIVKKNKMGELEQKLLFHDPNNPYSFISLYKDINGFIWAGTYGYGVFKIDPITLDIVNYNSKNGLSNDNVIHISGDEENIWLSTLGGGVTKYCISNSDQFKVYTSNDGLPSNYIYSTFTDSQKRTWIGTDGGGVAYFYQDSIYTFSNPDLDSVQKTVYSIVEDCKNNIWYNCANRGLYCYDGKTFKEYNESNGLKSNFVQGLTTDKMGNPVIISNEGIEIFVVKDSVFEYFSDKVGVADQEPNLNAVFKDNESNIWIGTANGIIKMNANSEKDTEILPKIFITEKSIFFNPITENRNSFSFKQKHLTFKYTALWYKSAEDLQYRYKLEGYDIDWNTPTSLRMMTYSNLPPGNYKFIVQVNYSGGKWISSKDSEYSFTIRKPFWKTYWFILSSIILILLAIYSFIKARLKKLLRDKEILEEEVRKRTAEIRQQKDEIEAQRDEIEAQRNYVTEQKDKIEQQNKNITSSIEYASRIQHAVLPPEEYFETYLGEYFIFFKPRDIVSGDFYYLNSIEDKVIVAAADCTGHGVPGAFMSILSISLLNKITADLKGDFNAGQILTSLRLEIKNALGQTGKMGEAKDGLDISLCVLDKEKNNLDFAGAYNPLIIIRDNEIIKYKGDKMPIGIFMREKETFTNHQIELQNGDSLYMYSDGFPDQFGGEHKKKFLAKNLNELLLKISSETIEKQKAILDKTLVDWMQDEHQIDDIVVLGFKI